MTTRRRFLASSSALFASWAVSGCRGGGAGAPRLASGAKDRKFIFITNTGGWDTTRVFASEFDNAANVDMESDAAPVTAGQISYVGHPTRPSVDSFFSQYNSNCLVVNGILVPSLAHEICTQLVLTGTPADSKPDVSAIIANARADQFTLPNAVISGPSFAGEFGTAVTRTGSAGQLDQLLSGSIINRSDTPVGSFSDEESKIIDAHLRARLDATAEIKLPAARLQRLNDVYLAAVDRAKALKDIREEIAFNRGNALLDRVGLAVDLLAKDISCCVSIGFNRFGWDSHTTNDSPQALNYEELFAGLLALMEGLKANNLLEDTLVVVLSEMGRTPKLNGTGGKDHWPYTSALLIGSGITTNRVIGGYDEFFNGLPIELNSGDVSVERGELLNSNSFCAALLNVAGIDHRPFLPGVKTVPAILA